MITAAQSAGGFTGLKHVNLGKHLAPRLAASMRGVVGEYFNTAQPSFEEGESLKGEEILTDAVRTPLDYISATRNLPHSDHCNHYRIIAAPGIGIGCPHTMKEFNWALSSRSAEDEHLSSAFGASTGMP